MPAPVFFSALNASMQIDSLSAFKGVSPVWTDRIRICFVHSLIEHDIPAIQLRLYLLLIASFKPIVLI